MNGREDLVGKTIVSRDEKLTGTITRVGERCRLEGCHGARVTAKWEDGHHTFPCTKGLVPHPKGLRIG